MATSVGVPQHSEVVDISSTNHTFADTRIHAIYCNAAGTVVGRLKGDNADTTWTVNAGQYLLGRWISVTKTGTTLTAAGAMIGCIPGAVGEVFSF